MASNSFSLAIVGGGLAGLAAAEAASRLGLRVEIFEARHQLGGRAGSVREKTTGQTIDCCQHLSLGACTAFADFRTRVGIDHTFKRYRQLHFFDQRGQRYDFGAAAWLPAPLHLLPSLLRLGYLAIGDRLRIIRTMGRLIRAVDHGSTAGQWLRAQGESTQSIEQFWSLIIASALGDEPDRVSLSAVRKVFCDGFLHGQHSYEIELPSVPLSELWDRCVGNVLADRGVMIHRNHRVRQVEVEGTTAMHVVLADGKRQTFDCVIMAVPWQRAAELLSPVLLASLPQVERARSFRSSPITAVHLWFDRPIMRLPHAVLVGRLSHWVFAGPIEKESHYVQIVISAAHALLHRDRQEIVQQVHEDLLATFPETRAARLIHSRVLTQPTAVFCCKPGLEQFRPEQVTGIDRLFLAGDWTATDWPATMEGAVRSGYLAMESMKRKV